jgi:dTDP-4-amino-4,6-dideoxygalactose transaminase
VRRGSTPLRFEQPIHVTRPLLPPLAELNAELEKVWASGWLTNGGEQHALLERELAEWLGAPNLSLFNNGTAALMVACQALQVTGEVVTSPFTFPATPHVLSWNKVAPVFADIDPETMNITPDTVAPLVTGATSAVLAVHVYGLPCDVRGIDRLARAQGLKVLYDGAHAFGTTIDGEPVARFGDATMFSFHATKLFHTAEGGALAVRDAETKARVDLLKNFGIRNEEEVVLPGINGKMNELQAALGRVVLRHVAAERARRERVGRIYRERLAGAAGLRIVAMPPGVTDSHQYLILRVDEQAAGCSRDALHARLKRFNIVTRKYFHPLCSQYDCYRHLPSARPERLPNAHRVAAEVLSLPHHGGLADDDVHRICDAIEYSLAR